MLGCFSYIAGAVGDTVTYDKQTTKQSKGISSRLRSCGSHRGGQVTTLVSARPAQAAYNIEHLELELHNKGGESVTNSFHSARRDTFTKLSGLMKERTEEDPSGR